MLGNQNNGAKAASVTQSQAAHLSHLQRGSVVDQPKSGESVEPRQLPLASAGARWLIAAAVLGSGMALLDGTVVNVALPTIGRDLGGGLTGQQWVLDGYLLTLSALLLSGGAAGDRYGRRRVFLAGLVVFTAAQGGGGEHDQSGQEDAATAVTVARGAPGEQ